MLIVNGSRSLCRLSGSKPSPSLPIHLHVLILGCVVGRTRPAQSQRSVLMLNVDRQLGFDIPPAKFGQWTQIAITWTSGPATSAQIRIIDSLIASDGNDFVIDDISFSAPEPATLACVIGPARSPACAAAGPGGGMRKLCAEGVPTPATTGGVRVFEDKAALHHAVVLVVDFYTLQ